MKVEIRVRVRGKRVELDVRERGESMDDVRETNIGHVLKESVEKWLALALSGNALTAEDKAEAHFDRLMEGR